MKKTIQMICLLIATLILSSCNPAISSEITLSNENKYETKDSIDMYITTDIHYLAPELTDNQGAFKVYVESGDGKNLFYIDDILEGMLDEIASAEGDFLIVSGDLTNNGEKASHEKLSEKFKALEEKGTDVYVIPGNHDINNPWARKFKDDKQYLTETVSPEEFAELYNDFGYEEAALRDDHSLSYLVTLTEDLWLLMLDTNKYDNNKPLGFPQGDGEIKDQTLVWLKEISDQAKKKGVKVLTVMHHNIMDHSEVIRNGFTLNNNIEVLEVLQAPNFQLFFSGHIHIQDIQSNKDYPDVYEIATSALSVNPHQYGQINYNGGSKKITYQTKQVDVASWSEQKKLTDEKLRGFESYAENFFGTFAYDMAYDRLVKSDSLSKEDMEAMSEMVKWLNIRYFAGTEHLNEADIVGSKSQELWNNYSAGFLNNYIESIIIDPNLDDNVFELQLTK